MLEMLSAHSGKCRFALPNFKASDHFLQLLMDRDWSTFALKLSSPQLKATIAHIIRGASNLLVAQGLAQEHS